MKSFNFFINEKLTVNKNTKLNTEIDYENAEDIANIYKAAVISILKNGSYEEGPTFKKIIKKIKYNDIIDILNEVFGYKNISYNEGKIKKGNIWRIISNDKSLIQDIVNGFTIHLKYNKEIKISGKELQQEYKNIINTK